MFGNNLQGRYIYDLGSGLGHVLAQFAYETDAVVRLDNNGDVIHLTYLWQLACFARVVAFCHRVENGLAD